MSSTTMSSTTMSSSSDDGRSPPDPRALGIGVMRLPFAADPARAVATMRAALDAGATWFDTARAYGDACERGLAEALRELGAVARTTVVTKVGMRREGPRWIPDGRARSVDADCAASEAALGDVPIGALLVHAPDPAVPWATTVRALARLHEAGRARRIGVSNVTRAQLDEALSLAPLSVIEVAFSLYDDEALAGGVVARALEAGLTVLAHAPFGGPSRAPRLARDPALAAIAAGLGVTVHQLVVAALRDLHPAIVPLPGPTRPETAGALAGAAALVLGDDDRAALEARSGWGAKLRPRARVAAPTRDGEVVLVMGLPGAGKSTAVAAWVERGYARLNRDERGGTLDALHAELDRRLGAGERRQVLDNLYLTRAGRRAVLDVAAAHGVPVRGLWLDTPLVQAERNVVTRIVRTVGQLPAPEALARSKVVGVLPPTSVLRLAREAEVPTADEGFEALEVVPFVRAPDPAATVAGRVIALDVVLDEGDRVRADADRWLAGDTPTLLFGWRPPPGRVIVAALARRGPITVLACEHGGGPPRCWCRPPLLGLPLVWGLPRAIDWAASTVVGRTPTHRAMAEALGARFVAADEV